MRNLSRVPPAPEPVENTAEQGSGIAEVESVQGRFRADGLVLGTDESGEEDVLFSGKLVPQPEIEAFFLFVPDASHLKPSKGPSGHIG